MADAPKLGRIEAEVLRVMRLISSPTDGGWCLNDGVPLEVDVPLTLYQFLSALGRLKRKGLATCHRWHSGQGVLTEFLWYPVPIGDSHE